MASKNPEYGGRLVGVTLVAVGAIGAAALLGGCGSKQTPECLSPTSVGTTSLDPGEQRQLRDGSLTEAVRAALTHNKTVQPDVVGIIVSDEYLAAHGSLAGIVDGAAVKAVGLQRGEGLQPDEAPNILSHHETPDDMIVVKSLRCSR